MCWSATADVCAGVVVLGIGAVGLGLTRHWRDAPLAGLPLLLGAHQLVEARIWHDAAGTGAWVKGPAVVAWTVIAFVVLPAFVPAAVLLAERRRRPVQWALAAVGVGVAAVLAFDVADGVHATPHAHVMNYGVGVPWLPPLVVGYLAATCLSFLTSTERTLVELGVALCLAAAVAAALTLMAFASVWCALAAVVSLLVVRRTLLVTGFA